MNAARELLAVARMLLSRTRKLDERSNVEREVREYVKGMGNNVVGELLKAIETGEKKLVKLWTKNKPSRFDYYYNALVLSVNYVEDKPDYGISNTVKSVNRLNEDGVVFGLIDMSYVIPDTRGT